MNINTFVESAVVTLTAVAWKVAGAFALWLVGRWLIAIALRMLRNALARQVVDATLARYAQTGLSVLLNGLRRVTRQRGHMALVCTNPTVLRLFEITRLDATFDIHPSREAALSAVRSAEG